MVNDRRGRCFFPPGRFSLSVQRFAKELFSRTISYLSTMWTDIAYKSFRFFSPVLCSVDLRRVLLKARSFSQTRSPPGANCFRSFRKRVPALSYSSLLRVPQGGFPRCMHPPILFASFSTGGTCHARAAAPSHSWKDICHTAEEGKESPREEKRIKAIQS